MFRKGLDETHVYERDGSKVTYRALTTLELTRCNDVRERAGQSRAMVEACAAAIVRVDVAAPMRAIDWRVEEDRARFFDAIEIDALAELAAHVMRVSVLEDKEKKSSSSP